MHFVMVPIGVMTPAIPIALEVWIVAPSFTAIGTMRSMGMSPVMR